MKKFPSNVDLAFYVRKQHIPKWAAKLQEANEKKPGYYVSLIDQCVNAHGGEQVKSFAAHNLMAIVKHMIKRGANIREELLRIADNPGCMIESEKRAAFARKWAKRIAR